MMHNSAINHYHATDILSSIMYAIVAHCSLTCIENLIVQVDGTWLYEKYIDTLLITTAHDNANHIFPIAYAIVEGETTSCWGFC